MHEGEGIEGDRRAEPDELRRPDVEVGLKHLGMAPAHRAVDAIGAHDQIGAGQPQAFEIAVILEFRLKPQIHPQLLGAPLKDAEQRAASDAGEAVAAGRNRRPLVVDVDVVPAGEMGGNGGVRLGIGGLKVAKGLLGEDHPPTEGIVRPVALQDGNPVRRIGLFHQQGEVEPGGTTPEDRDVHGRQSMRCRALRPSPPGPLSRPHTRTPGRGGAREIQPQRHPWTLRKRNHIWRCC